MQQLAFPKLKQTRARLTREAAITIVQLVLDGYRTDSIAARFGVSQSAINWKLADCMGVSIPKIRALGKQGKTAEQIVDESPRFAPKVHKALMPFHPDRDEKSPPDSLMRSILAKLAIVPHNKLEAVNNYLLELTKEEIRYEYQ